VAVIDPFRARVLALTAATEDYAGFYELLWELNTQWPDASAAEKLSAARSTLTRLLEEGLVDVYFTKWMSDDLERVPHPRAIELVGEDASWKTPDEQPERRYPAFTTNEAGERAYRALPAEAFEGLWG